MYNYPRVILVARSAGTGIKNQGNNNDENVLIESGFFNFCGTFVTVRMLLFAC